MPAPFDAATNRAILLDIEGTTTPVTFVYDVLFPYARAHLREFLRKHSHESGMREDIARLYSEHASETGEAPPWKEDSAEARVESAAAYALWLMERDRKSTGLKSLQGKIWEAGYRSGELRGEVYPDVAPALARWRNQGRRLAIFSSGSVLAQKLLFAHSTAGDLTRYLDSYFDTTTGPKQDPSSYRLVAEALVLPPGSILFLSDVVPELDAARAAGMNAALCVRSDAPARNDQLHPIIRTFDDLFP